MLTINNLTYAPEDKVIFKNLSFSLAISSALIVVGRNGCGKSSLLKIIAGIYEATKGKILWNNQDIKNFRGDFNADIRYIGHKNYLKSELTIHENLRFYARLHDTEMALESALEFFGLLKYKNYLIKDLSAGWQQKVMLTTLLACPATLWILDEPSNNLDSENRKFLHDLIKNRIKDKGMVILTTHDEMYFDLGQRLYLEDYKS